MSSGPGAQSTSRRLRLRLGRAVSSAIATTAVGAVALGAGAAPASAADACPNAAIRAQQQAQFLPDCRAYEMVSPPNKAGYPIPFSERAVRTGVTKLSPDGNAAVYASYGAFAGATSGLPQTYRAVRSPDGWRSRAVSPSTVTDHPNASLNYANIWAEATPDLRFGLISTRDELDGAGAPDTSDIYVGTDEGAATPMTVGENGERVPAGGDITEGYMSDDGSSVAFPTTLHFAAGDEDRAVDPYGTIQDVYLRRHGATTLLNQAADGTLLNKCGSVLGGSNWATGVETTRNALGPDGSQVIFSVPMGSFDFTDPDCLSPARIFIWRENKELVEVSASEASVPDAQQAAAYQGATTDGSRVLFTSNARLIDGVSSGGLYVFDLNAPEGSRLSQAVAASYISVVKTSNDGNTVYFMSGDDLAPGGDPDVLYSLFVYRRTPSGSTVKWVADDLAGDFTAGLQELGREVRISEDGTVLSFASAAPLTGFDNVNPRTGQRTMQVFVYDDRVGEVRCASCDPAGQRPEGSLITGDASVGPTGNYSTPLVVSDDGQVFFSSPDQLVPEDVNGKRDVYEFSGGRVHLISSGRGRDDAQLAYVSRSGDTVMFATSDSLVTQDADAGDVDLYVAQVDGGFAAASTEPKRPCDGDACQGSPAAVPGLPSAGSVTFDGGGEGTPRPLGAVRVSGARSVSGVAARLRVQVPSRGTIRLSGARVASRSKAVGKAGTYALPVRLSRTAQSVVRKRGRLTTVVVVRFVRADGESRSVRVRVTFKAKGSK